MRKWHGVSVLPRVRSGLEAELRELAPAVCSLLKIGAISRICTGIP
jgi:hypothetical protein